MIEEERYRHLLRAYPYKTRQEILALPELDMDLMKQYISEGDKLSKDNKKRVKIAYKNWAKAEGDKTIRLKNYRSEVNDIVSMYQHRIELLTRYRNEETDCGTPKRWKVNKTISNLHFLLGQISFPHDPWAAIEDKIGGIAALIALGAFALIILGLVGYFIVWPILQILFAILFPYLLDSGPNWGTDPSTDMMWTFCAIWGIIIFIGMVIGRFR